MMNIEWEPINITSRHRSHKAKTIWLAGSDKNRVNKVCISADLIAQLRWAPGTRVDAFRSGSMFKFQPAKVGLYTLRVQTQNSKTLVITDSALAHELRAFSEASEFDAWIDGEALLFKKKEGA